MFQVVATNIYVGMNWNELGSVDILFEGAKAIKKLFVIDITITIHVDLDTTLFDISEFLKLLSTESYMFIGRGNM